MYHLTRACLLPKYCFHPFWAHPWVKSSTACSFHKINSHHTSKCVTLYLNTSTDFASKRNVHPEPTPNWILKSIRVQSLLAHAFSGTSNTVIVHYIMFTSSCPIVSPLKLNCANTICSSDHSELWFASSYNRSHK